MKYIIFSVMLLGLAGCISIEAPDTLVSDSVKAGKDVYHSVKESWSDEPTPERRTFLHKYKIPEGEVIGESNVKCIKITMETAKQTLNVEKLDIVEILTNPIVENEESILECSIVVLSL